MIKYSKWPAYDRGSTGEVKIKLTGWKWVDDCLSTDGGNKPKK